MQLKTTVYSIKHLSDLISMHIYCTWKCFCAVRRKRESGCPPYVHMNILATNISALRKGGFPPGIFTFVSWMNEKSTYSVPVWWGAPGSSSCLAANELKTDKTGRPSVPFNVCAAQERTWKHWKNYGSGGSRAFVSLCVRVVCAVLC